jgi:hypothetical protein
MNNKQILKKLYIAQSKYESSVGYVEALIKDNIPFDFSVIFQDSDGWLLLNAGTNNLAPLDSCLIVIENNGTLTEEDFKQLAI